MCIRGLQECFAGSLSRKLHNDLWLRTGTVRHRSTVPSHQSYFGYISPRGGTLQRHGRPQRTCRAITSSNKAEASENAGKIA